MLLYIYAFYIYMYRYMLGWTYKVPLSFGEGTQPTWPPCELLFFSASWPVVLFFWHTSLYRSQVQGRRGPVSSKYPAQLLSE